MDFQTFFSRPATGDALTAGGDDQAAAIDYFLNSGSNGAPAMAPAPTMMQEPAGVDLLRSSWKSALEGLAPALKKDQQAQKADKSRDFWDSLAGNVLIPLAASRTPAYADEAMKSSDTILKSLEHRRAERKSEASQQMELIGNLAKVVKASDPNDIGNMLKRIREDRMQRNQNFKEGKESNRFAFDQKKFEWTKEHGKSLEKLAQQNANRGDSSLEWTKEHGRTMEKIAQQNANRGDNSLQEQIRYHKESTAVHIQEMLDRKEIADRRGDMEESKYLDGLIKQSIVEYDKAQKIEMDLREKAYAYAQKDQASAMKKNKDGDLLYPEFKPGSQGDHYMAITGRPMPGGAPVVVPPGLGGPGPMPMPQQSAPVTPGFVSAPVGGPDMAKQQLSTQLDLVRAALKRKQQSKVAKR